MGSKRKRHILKDTAKRPSEELFTKDSVPPRRLPETLIFLSIVIAAFIVRFIYLNQIKTNPFFVPFYHGLDDYIYDEWARTIAGGDLLGKEVFYGLPLYPYFLAFIYFLFGHNIFIAKLAQFLIGSLSCGLVYIIGRKVFNRHTGLIAAAIMVFCSTAIYFEGFFVSAFLAIFLNLLTVLLLLDIKNRHGFARFFFTGLLLGLSCLANASVLIFLPFAVFWLFKYLKGLHNARIAAYAATLLAGVLLAIAPVTVRNYIVAKDFVPITAHGGITFYGGNNPGSDGSFYLPKEISTSAIEAKNNSMIIAERSLGKPLKPSEVSRYWFGQGMAFINKDKIGYLGFALKKAILFWNAYDIPDILPISFFRQYAPLLRLPLVSFAILGPLSILGMLLCARFKGADVPLLYLFVASVLVSTIIYFVNSRYRLIAFPYLAIFAGAAVFRIYTDVRAHRFTAAAVSSAALVLLILLAHIKILEFKDAQAYNSLGIILKRQGLYDRAVDAYKKAIEIDGGYDSPYFNIGLLYFERKDFDAAIKYFELALKVNPSLADAHDYLDRARFYRKGP